MDEQVGGETSLSANTDHPRLTDAFQKLHELDATIQELPIEAVATLAKKHGCLISISNWQYWEEILLYTTLLQ